jgi:1,4-dihydroxy-2-naphthoate octaprenyltransferase
LEISAFRRSGFVCFCSRFNSNSITAHKQFPFSSPAIILPALIGMICSCEINHKSSIRRHDDDDDGKRRELEIKEQSSVFLAINYVAMATHEKRTWIFLVL